MRAVGNAKPPQLFLTNEIVNLGVGRGLWRKTVGGRELLQDGKYCPTCSSKLIEEMDSPGLVQSSDVVDGKRVFADSLHTCLVCGYQWMDEAQSGESFDDAAELGERLRRRLEDA